MQDLPRAEQTGKRSERDLQYPVVLRIASQNGADLHPQDRYFVVQSVDRGGGRDVLLLGRGQHSRIEAVFPGVLVARLATPFSLVVCFDNHSFFLLQDLTSWPALRLAE